MIRSAELKMLELCGFDFGVDFDGELTVEPPKAVDVARLEQFVIEHHEDLAATVLHRGQRSRRQCYGGPFDGKRFDWWNPFYTPDGQPEIAYFKGAPVARARWAVYRVRSDGRCYFVGYARSEAKARRGELFETARAT